MNLSEHEKSFILKHSEESFPNECGGIILENSIHRCHNFSSSPEESCVISRDEANEKAGGLEIKALYHSHVNDNEDFSWEDKALSEEFGIKLVLCSVAKKLFKCYKPNGFISPFVGRKWIQGVFTCISIIEDYYKKYFNIEIKGNDEVEFCGKKLKYMDVTALYMQSFPGRKNYNPLATTFLETAGKDKLWSFVLDQSGFYEVKDLKKHDVILCRGLDERWNRKFNIDYAIHAAIYLGNRKILHHRYKLESTIEKLTPAFKLSIHKVYRHNKLA